jgi:hypothetical protein
MPLKQSNSDELNAYLEGHPFAEGYAYLFICHDQSAVTLEQIRYTVEGTGVTILDVAVVSKGPEREQSVLLKLDSQDAREIVRRMANHKLIAVEGYNAGNRAVGKH